MAPWGHPGSEWDSSLMTPLILPPLPHDPPTMVSRARSHQGGPPLLLGTRDMGVTVVDPWHEPSPSTPLSPMGSSPGVSHHQGQGWVPLPALGWALWHPPVPINPQGTPRGSLARGDPKTPPCPPAGCTLGCCLPSLSAAAATPSSGPAADPLVPGHPSWRHWGSTGGHQGGDSRGDTARLR